MRWNRTLTWLAVINVIVATAHCVDNMVFFDDYPEPDWITGPMVVDALFLVALGLLSLGVVAFRRRRRSLSVLGLTGFGLISASALGHYLYAPVSDLSLRMNALIFAEAVAALVLLGFVAASQARWPRVVAS
ncbi:MAG: hypothetical protein AAF229_14555 [Pseudomonadota bacterium]